MMSRLLTPTSGLVALVAATILAGCSPSATPPDQSSPSASPSIIVAPSGLALPGEVTVDPSLPDALPLPDDIWEQTGPGWVLATYLPQNTWYSDAKQDWMTDYTKHVVYLVSPEGQRYQVLELDPEQRVLIESWTAGETQAIVWDGILSDAEDRDIFEVLDLTTGELSLHNTPITGGRVELTLPDSARIWQEVYEYQTYIDRSGEFVSLAQGWILTGRDPAAPSPDGRWAVVRQYSNAREVGYPLPIGVVRLDTGEITLFPALDSQSWCGPRGWTDSGALLVNCAFEPGDPLRYFEADPSTGTVTESGYVVPADDPIGLHHDFWISPGVWAGNGGVGAGEGDQETGLGVEDRGVIREILVTDENGIPLPMAVLVAAVEGVLYLDDGPVVIAYDLATDEQVVLLPASPDTSALGPSVGLTGVTSWVVAP